MRILVLALLATLPAWSQGPLPANWREASELLPAAPVVVTSPHNIVITRTSSTALSIGDGASASAPQTVRLRGPANGQFRTRQLTSALTLTSTTGGGTGTIFVFGIPSGNNLEIVVVNNLGGTLTCTGSTPCSISTSAGAKGRQAIGSGIYLYSWGMSTGSPATFDVSGGVSQPTVVPDAWLERVEITNTTGSSVAVALQNAPGTWATGTVTIPLGTVWSYKFGEPRQGQYFEGGLQVTAGTANALRIKTVWVTDNLVFNPAPPR